MFNLEHLFLLFGACQNFKGHQAPFISLGDLTVIEENMTFSVEPGLYDEKNGIGDQSSISSPETKTWSMSISPRFTSTKGLPFFKPTIPNPVAVARKLLKSLPICESM